jgi:hypothetical protein
MAAGPAASPPEFRAALQVRELARLHDPVRGLPEEPVGHHRQASWPSGGMTTDDEPGAPFR